MTPCSDYPAFCEDTKLLEKVAREAGDVALKFFMKDPEVWTKKNDSPVTEADLAVNQLIAERLIAARPNYGWLSEESDDNDERLDKRRVFVIDPIDGTRAFIDGGDEWTISLAVVENQRPVAAALYAPVRHEMYLASKLSGATLNGTRLRSPQFRTLEGARAAGPRIVIDKGPLARAGVVGRGYIRSLAYRIVMVANGALDLALAREHANDWDLAAADLIVEEAGGVLRDHTNQPLRYNRKDCRHGSLYAAGHPIADIMAPIISVLNFPKRHGSRA
ncbi:3'(2'),5'-bisphosphate nucleotidase CysQ [uncultured Cohaesibacter sp.]|uniref:3'(2'),5'-bisphosphate nucleotidase CysQ n=1 Tax=uncultured Cohaesibacter sp. TaxID=1002546 RepID=UPI0029C7EB15|nr:3'(2'),5'-bisphosphate nucleotidase CysQ [uncultured Cohaesibacter sp.]